MNPIDAIHVPTLGGSANDVRTELDAMVAGMQTWSFLQPDEVISQIIGYRSRLVELAIRIARIEDELKHLRTLRTREIEPLVEAMGEIYAMVSRLVSVRELDFRVESSGRSATP